MHLRGEGCSRTRRSRIHTRHRHKKKEAQAQHQPKTPTSPLSSGIGDTPALSHRAPPEDQEESKAETQSQGEASCTMQKPGMLPHIGFTEKSSSPLSPMQHKARHHAKGHDTGEKFTQQTWRGPDWMTTAVSPTVTARDNCEGAGNGTGSAKLPGPASYSTVACHVVKPVPGTGWQTTCRSTIEHTPQGKNQSNEEQDPTLRGAEPAAVRHCPCLPRANKGPKTHTQNLQN